MSHYGLDKVAAEFSIGSIEGKKINRNSEYDVTLPAGSCHPVTAFKDLDGRFLVSFDLRDDAQKKTYQIDVMLFRR